MDHYGVSRVTIRAALATLQAEGLISRRRGSGTVVQSHVFHKIPGQLVDFHREAEGLGHRPGSRVLSLGRRPGLIRERLAFDLPPGSEVVVLKRLRLLDGVPVVLQTSSHPPEVLAGISAEELEDHSLYELLGRRKGLWVREAEHVLEPFAVEPPEADLLRLPPGTAVLRAHRTARDGKGRVLEMAENLIRGDYFKYTFSLRASRVVD